MSDPAADYPPPPVEKVGPWRRLLARIIDSLVLVVPVLIVTGIIGGGYQVGTGNDTAREFLATGAGVLMSYAYFVLMESSRGATLGKSALEVAMHGEADRPPTTAQVAKRNAWMLLAIVPGTVGGLLSFVVAIAIGVTIGNDPRGRGWHDRWANVVPTRV